VVWQPPQKARGRAGATGVFEYDVGKNETALSLVRDEFFPFMRTNLQQHPLGRYLKDANCLIPSGNLLSRAVAAIEELPLTEGDAKGDIYEHLLGNPTCRSLR